MKRKVFIILALVSLLAAIAYAMRTPTSVDWATFQPSIREAFHSHGYIMMEQRGANQREVTLPFRVWLHRPFEKWHGPAHLEFGFPNGAECYTVRCQDSLEVDCAVRYLDGRASVIEIRFPAAANAAATDLKSLLENEFPGLPIRLTRQ